MNRDSDLAKAFRHARAFYGYSNAPRRPAPLAAREALAKARGLVAALPALKAAEDAARAALEAQRAIDGRRYAPGMEKARADLDKAAKAYREGRAFLYSGPVWEKGYSGTWQSEKGLFYADEAESLFRNVIAAHELQSGRDVARGYYTNSHGDDSNLCVAYVVQLPSRNGRARYAPGYSFAESDNQGKGITVDLSRIEESDFVAERESARRQIGKAYWTPAMEAPGYWADGAHEAARKEAARVAQGMAERAAEEEREYQTAWAAGDAWARRKEDEAEARAEALAILAERRKARALAPEAFPALCAALRGKVAGLVRRIQKSREERAELQEGDAAELYFCPREERLREAFCDGAGLDSFPA